MKLGTLVARKILQGDVAGARLVAAENPFHGSWSVPELRAISKAIEVAEERYPGVQGNVTMEQFMTCHCDHCTRARATWHGLRPSAEQVAMWEA